MLLTRPKLPLTATSEHVNSLSKTNWDLTLATLQSKAFELSSSELTELVYAGVASASLREVELLLGLVTVTPQEGDTAASEQQTELCPTAS